MHTLYIFMTHTHSDARSLKCSVRCYEHVITLLLKRITPKEIEPLKGNIIFYLTISLILLVTISQLVAILCGGTSAVCVGHQGNPQRQTGHLRSAVYRIHWSYHSNCNFQLITAPARQVRHITCSYSEEF